MENLEKIMELEGLITDEIQKGDNNVKLTFNYSTTMINRTIVKVFTRNPVSKEFFLLSSAVSINTVSALEILLEYAQTHKSDMSSFTVVWVRRGGTQTTSYFYCKNVVELIEKFFDGKDPSLYIIYEIKLNPIA